VQQDAQYWVDIQHAECGDSDALPVAPDWFATQRDAHIDAIVDGERRLAAAHRNRAVGIARRVRERQHPWSMDKRQHV
jgi:hypothetical protein